MENFSEYKDVCKKTGSYACGFIGCGNMSSAIIQGLIKSKLFDPSEIIVSATRPASFEKWKSLKVNTTLNNRELSQKSRIVFLCVKPNAVGSVAESIRTVNNSSEVDYEDDHKSSPQTLVSILAGTSIESLKQAFDDTIIRNFNFIRAMPNTPLMVCAGATALTQDISKSKDSQLNFKGE
jgi:pyrroline-5-carboxylate reductase